MENMALRQASEKWRVIARWVNRQDTDRCNFGVVRMEIIGMTQMTQSSQVIKIQNK